MEQKAFVLQNKGMNRDLSISKTGESSAYENHNIRITALDHDTLLSVTNERGNREISLGTHIEGTLLGWNVLNEHVILFTHEDNNVDRIYRVDYHPERDYDQFECILLFENDLNFDCDHPIESVVYHETDDIQKVYWVDGKNVLRFMNFMAKPDESTGLYPWQDGHGYDSTYFDSNRKAEFGVKVSISKDNSGNSRANGITQYLLTYFNNHGQETGYVWVSDLVYLSPLTHGGAADGTNANSVKLSISNLDTRFTNFRVYSIFRSSLNGTVLSYLVGEGKTEGGVATVVDDGAHLVVQDSSRLLYLGSQEVHAGTLTHKDQTLFLGDLVSVGHDYKWIKKEIKDAGMYNSEGIASDSCLRFVYSETDGCPILNIPYVEDEGTYSYENQLQYTSSGITTFKGGEKYRFALKFQLDDGTETPAFWIGDKVNQLYPVIDKETNSIKRAVARFSFPPSLLTKLRNSEMNIRTVQLCIAEATYADRSVKAQGILNPTMFNTWERYNKRIYSIPSWISRPRNSGYANRHFQSVDKSTMSTGEIACNWWSSENHAPRPFYQYVYDDGGTEYVDDYEGRASYDYLMASYYIQLVPAVFEYSFVAMPVVFRMSVKPGGDENRARQFLFTQENYPYTFEEDKVIADTEDCTIICYAGSVFTVSSGSSQSGWARGIESIHSKIAEYFENKLGLSVASDEVVGLEQLSRWYSSLNHGVIGRTRYRFFTINGNSEGFENWIDCWNDGNSDNPSIHRWMKGEQHLDGNNGSYIPAFYTKQYMFVDENVVTLNSPEFDYEAVGIDSNSGLKIRVIGAAKISSGNSDYTVEASPGKKPGENVLDEHFSWTASFGNPDGLLSWPLWEDRNLDEYKENDSDELPEVKNRTSKDYVWGGGVRRYWLRMWERTGSITGFIDEDNHDYGTLHRKVFANQKYAYETIYCTWADRLEYGLNDLRQYNHVASQLVFLNIGNEKKYYNGNVQMSLMAPDRFKYPIPYSIGVQNTNAELEAGTDDCYLYSSDPVNIEIMSNPHAVLSLASSKDNGVYRQRILPFLNDGEEVAPYIPVSEVSYLTSDALIPWIEQDPTVGYRVDEDKLTVEGISSGDRYLLIGELYQEYDEEHPDERYGGITDMDIENCRFITAGPQYVLGDMDGTIFGDQGDTYFQRWDCLKTKPYSTGSVNNVIDITSVMVETHINIDGRTDLQRGIDDIASIDTEKFGQLNPVYSQKNNYRIQRDYDEDFYTDAYRSSITWSLEKHDSEDVDEWSHVTLASTLKLDGDKGVCQALRRFNNSIIAFQDRGISEILFNSRTQLTTQDGVPVEIANSGKVDGKRYITNKFGCTNKWSIVEGKSALYFVDNINKMFCSFSGQGIKPLSDILGFGTWFKRNNTLASWNPVSFCNIVSFYDRIHSDVYLVKDNDSDAQSCLVYNEALGAFTSFFDYASVPMMANVKDRFVSFRDGRLWGQHEGLYCNFFGKQYDYWMQYRVTPEPYSDKIWTNIDYRADFYEVLDRNGNSIVSEETLINGEPNEDLADRYKEWETFTDYKVWNEYQTTGFTPFVNQKFDKWDVRKKFRIWRLVVPRAMKEGTNRHGLDRIRNPWVNLMFRKSGGDPRNLVQLHDIVVKYFE